MSYPYQKHIWVTREIIRREYLQNIEDGIYDEQQERERVEGLLSQAITDETNRATAAENALDAAIEAEETRAIGAESDLSSAISAEQARAVSVEDTLASDILSLDNRISSEYTRATNAESSLASSIQTEATRAANAESALGTRVSNLETTATRAYKAAGSVLFADLPSATENRQGYVYNILDDFTTTSDFVEGAGKDYSAGTNVAIVGIESSGTTTYKYDVMSGFVDTSDFITNTDYATQSTAGIVRPDGTTTTVDANGVISAVGGGQTGGHIIQNSSGTSMAERDILQFLNCSVTDDSTNNKTKVTPSCIPVFSSPTYSTLADFYTKADELMTSIGAKVCLIRCKFSTDVGFGTGWFRFLISSQNTLGNGVNDISATVLQMAPNCFKFYKISGGKTDTSDLALTLMFDGTATDTTPTSGSTNLITSGGVYSYIDTMITQAISASY